MPVRLITLKEAAEACYAVKLRACNHDRMGLHAFAPARGNAHRSEMRLALPSLDDYAILLPYCRYSYNPSDNPSVLFSFGSAHS